MTGISQTPSQTGAPLLLALRALRRTGRLRLGKKPSRAQAAAAPTATRSEMRNDGIGVLVKTVIFSALTVAYVVAEVLVAMFVYMYLNLRHIETFGSLIITCQKLLNLFGEQLQRVSPELASPRAGRLFKAPGAPRHP